MKIKNAIIIHGPGRSGTTLLDNILSLHDDLYWISSYTNKYPKYPIFSTLNAIQRIPFIEKNTRKNKLFPRPNEAYNFWLHHFEDFNSYENNHFDQQQINNCNNSLKKINQYTLGSRFTTKLTGLSRFEYIDALFENPHIIWIDRKPQAVVMSYYKQRWMYKNKPELFNSKSTSSLIEEYVQFYDRIFNDKEQLKKFNFLQVSYEDLIADKEGFFKKVCAFTNLDFNTKFKNHVNSWEIIPNTNSNYLKNLSPEEISLLNSSLLKHSKALGYL